MDKFLYASPKYLARWICAMRPSPMAEKIVWMVERFWQELNNVNFNFHTNGESKILEGLQHISPEVIVDVGSNVGSYALVARKFCPKAIIHSLEILPANYSTLLENVKNDSKIITHNFGLSDVAGEITIYSSSQSELNETATSSKITEMQEHRESYDVETVCDVQTGIDFMKNQNLDVKELGLYAWVPYVGAISSTFSRFFLFVTELWIYNWKSVSETCPFF